MMTERTSGHSARGSPRRSAVAAIQIHVAVGAFGEELLQPRLSAAAIASGRVMPTTSKPRRAAAVDAALL